MKSSNYIIVKSILVIIITGMLFSCRNDIEQVKVFSDIKSTASQVFYDTEFIFTENANTKNKLKAKKLERFIEGDDPFMKASEGLELFFMDTSETPEAILTANQGIFYENRGVMEAIGNVILINNTNDTLYTEYLKWVNDSNLMTTNQFVKIANDDGTIYGKGMTANGDFTEYKILHPVGNINFETE